jgi:ceramide glucosyltransferase
MWSWAALGSIAVLRLLVAMAVGGKVLRDRQVLKFAWLIPLRDLLAVAVWVASFAGRTVTWRGDRFILKNGKLTRIAT